VATLFWTPSARRSYENLGEPRTDVGPRLLNAIEGVLDQLVTNPNTVAMKRRQRRTPSGLIIWKIEIRGRTDDWTLLWMEHPDEPKDVLIVYLGPADYQQ